MFVSAEVNVLFMSTSAVNDVSAQIHDCHSTVRERLLVIQLNSQRNYTSPFCVPEATC